MQCAVRCKRPRGYLRARAAGGARQRGAVHTRGPAPATVTEVQAVQGRPAEWRTRGVSLRPKCIRSAPIESAGAQRASGRRAAAGSRRTSQRDGGGGDDGEQAEVHSPASWARCVFTVEAFTADPAGSRLETRVLDASSSFDALCSTTPAQPNTHRDAQVCAPHRICHARATSEMQRARTLWTASGCSRVISRCISSTNQFVV